MFTRSVAFFLLLAITSWVQAQILQPAKLTAETPAKNFNIGDEVELTFKATIDKGWYIYSVGFDEDCGLFPLQ